MKYSKKRPGIAMIYALAVFIFVSLLSVALLRITTGNTSTSVSEFKRTHAEYAARAGIEIGLAALEAEDITMGKTTLCERVLGKVSDPSYSLDTGYTNITSSNPRGDVIDVLSESGAVVGRVQIVIYSLTDREGDPGDLTFQYMTPDASGNSSKTIHRHAESEKLGINSTQDWSWVFRVVAIGETLDYEQSKHKYPMARQIMTAEVKMSSEPKEVKLYSGY